MPSLQDIREFNDSLLRIADEPAVIREWGEEVEALPEPDEGLDNDLSSLLADTGDLGGAGEIEDIADIPATPPETSGEMESDLSDLLGEDIEADEPTSPDGGDSAPSVDDVFDSPAAPTPPESESIAEEGVGDQLPDAPTPEAVPDDDIDFSDFEALLSDTPPPGPDASNLDGSPDSGTAGVGTTPTEEPFGDADPFAGADPFGATDDTSSAEADPFAGADPFGTADDTPVAEADPFAETDPFGTADDTPVAEADPFADADPFGAAEDTSSAEADPFAETDPFGTADDTPIAEADPFAGADPFGTADDTPVAEADPFAGADPFGTADDTPVAEADPFADADPFGAAEDTSSAEADPFAETDPFGAADDTSSAEADPFAGADPFGAADDTPSAEDDPFAETDPFGTADETPFGTEADPFGATDPFGETPDAGVGADEFSFDDESISSGQESAAGPAPAESDDDDIFGLPDGGEELDADGGIADQDSGDEEADFGDLAAFEFSDEDDDVVSTTSDDAFAFDDPTVPGGDGLDTSAFDDVASPGGDGEASDLEEIDAGSIDEFSLGDFGAEFGVIGDDGLPTEEDLNPALGIPATTPGVTAAATGEFQISDDDFQTLQSTMSSLPLNLKVEIVGIVTEAKGTTDQVENLIRRLAAGESPIDIAALASKILGKQVRIPRGYEKRSGLDFEAERQSFSYQFRENILPILRTVALFVVAAAIVGLAGYHLVFRPLHARSLYREGLALIAEDQYTLGNQTFVRAREVWASNSWFYEYAEAFINERQYTLAGEKYEQLLFGMNPDEREFYNDLLAEARYAVIVEAREPEKRGILDYARLESEVLANYAQADRLLQLILVSDVGDFEGRLAIGDNYMLWADTDPARYEDARVAYTRLMERYGQTNQLLFRMLRYFIRTDNLTEVVILKDLFQNDPRLSVEADKYAEMAGYLIENNMLDDVEEVLFRALDTNRFIPDIHYNLARYYRLINAPGEEELALRTARTLLTEASPKTRQVRGMLVDTITRQGENFAEAERFLEAQESFGEAIEEYEEGLRRRVLAPDPMYGRAYSHLADIFYYIGRQYDDALRYLNAAEENGYHEPNLDYKQGFILYRNGQLDSALGEFREAATDPAGSTNALLWATANTYFARQNYFAAEAYYRELLDRVELQRDSIRTLLVDEDPLHQSAVEYLIRVNNNLGVTLSKLSQATGDADYFATALIYLTQSIEYSENYRRDPDTLVRSGAIDLAYLNQRELLYPTPEYAMQIYNMLPEDLDDPVF